MIVDLSHTHRHITDCKRDTAFCRLKSFLFVTNCRLAKYNVNFLFGTRMNTTDLLIYIICENILISAQIFFIYELKVNERNDFNVMHSSRSRFFVVVLNTIFVICLLIVTQHYVPRSKHMW